MKECSIRSLLIITGLLLLSSCGEDLLLDESERDTRSGTGRERQLNESEFLPEPQVQKLEMLCSAVKASHTYYNRLAQNETSLRYEDTFRECNDSAVTRRFPYELKIEAKLGTPKAYRFRAIVGEPTPYFYDLPNVEEVGMWKRVCDHIDEARARNQRPKSFFRDSGPVWIGALDATSDRCPAGVQGMCLTLEFGTSVNNSKIYYRVSESQLYAIETGSFNNRGALLEFSRSRLCDEEARNKTQELKMSFVP